MKNQLLFQLKSGLPWFGGGVLLAALLAFTVYEETPACAIALDSTNVMYRGIDNPVVILVRGVPEEHINIKTEGITLKKAGNSMHYTARASAVDEAKITISGGDLKPTEFKFRVKKMPDPEMYLGKRRGGAILVGEFIRTSGISAIITCCGFDARAEVVSYDVIYKGSKEETLKNNGARYSTEVKQLIDRAKPGDTYKFDNILIRMPGDGDKETRDMDAMVFKIE